jgi:hypothetical protein
MRMIVQLDNCQRWLTDDERGFVQRTPLPVREERALRSVNAVAGPA